MPPLQSGHLRWRLCNKLSLPGACSHYFLERASLRGLLLLLLCAVINPGHAQVFDRLYEDSAQPALAQPLVWAALPRGSVASPDSLPGAANFQPYSADTVLPTSDRQEVWARFALPATETPQTWFLRVPRQNIVRVTLFSRDPQGNWNSQSAGESIAPAQWALRTRVPSFQLQTRSTTEKIYYLRFEHRIAVTERPMLLSPIEYVDGASRVGVVIGLMWGMFGLFATLSVAAFVITRNRVFVWFGAFVATLMFAQLVLIGYGGWRIWPQSVQLTQMMPWVSSALALAAAAWFCAQASYARDSHPHIFRLLAFVAAGSLLLACMVAINNELVPRMLRNLWVAGATISVVAALVWMSVRGQKWNLLLLAGAAPIGLAALARLSYNVGWAVHVEFAQTAGVFSAMLGLIWQFLILAWRSRSALFSHERAVALATYDPATGLMLPDIIDIRLPQMLLRAGRLKPGCGILMLRWLEHSQTPAVMNNEKRSATLARIGAILRGASRDIDTVVRYSEDEFVMLVEGPVTRNALSEAATQIVAACIRSSQKVGNTLTINLHIAIWHGGAGIHITEAVMDLLKARLRQMASGTRRPVQFVDAAGEAADFQGSDPNQRKMDLIAKIDALETSHPPTVAARTPARPSASGGPAS